MPLGPSQQTLIGGLAREGELVSADRALIAKEVSEGLPNARLRIACALENQAFYDLDGERYAPRRESETEFDYDGRGQDETGFTQEVVDVLCEHQYDPGPARSFPDAAEAETLLNQVYEQNHIDALMQRAEVLSTLNDVAAIEVRVTDDPDRPVDLHVWGSEEFEVFIDPADPRKPLAVVTIDRVNQQTRYRLWFPDVVRTFITQPYSPARTSGAVFAHEQPPEENTYGCLPFAFVHYRPPVHRFWTPGMGTFLRKLELRANQIASGATEVLLRYGLPIGVATNVPVEWNPELGPARFVRLYQSMTGYQGDGFGAGGQPSLAYMQAQFAIEERWAHIQALLNQGLQAARAPLSAVRMEQQGFTSGIALIAEQAPLLKRACTRRKMLGIFEADLARTICRVVGGHRDDATLLKASKALKPLLTWPEPAIPIPGPERDANDDWELEHGVVSLPEVVMRRKGFATVDQAVAHIEEVAKLNKRVEDVLPKPEPQQGQEPAEGEPNDDQPPHEPAGDE